MQIVSLPCDGRRTVFDKSLAQGEKKSNNKQQQQQDNKINEVKRTVIHTKPILAICHPCKPTQCS